MVRSNAAGSMDRTMPVGATPALATTTSMPPKRSTAASTASPSASTSVMSASKAARARAALLGHARKLLGLEAHEGHVRAAGGEPYGRTPPRCPARRR